MDDSPVPGATPAGVAEVSGASAEPAWLTAMGELEALQRAAETAQVVQAAHHSGLLHLLTVPTDADVAAATVGVAPARLLAVLRLLAANGIVSRTDAAWVLTPGWTDLVSGSSPVSFDGTLGLSRVWAEQFEKSLSPVPDYWQLTPAHRLLVARGISPEPAAAATVSMVRRDLESVDGLGEFLDAGGRILELGCGVASRLSATLLAFPAAQGVGVELDPALARFARDRAVALGIEARLTLVVGDAATYEPDGSFDLVSWSQFFFPAHTRTAALKTARRALRPGGWIRMPVIWDGVAPAPRSVEDRELAAMSLVLDLWGIPLRTVAEVQAELEAAGFVDVFTDKGFGALFVRARQPE